MAKVTFKIEGLSELQEALQELPKATGRNVLKRALVKAAQPMADTARSLAPRGVTGKLSREIFASASIENTVGKAEFAAAMSAGLGQDAAVQALRDARRSAAGKGSFAEVAVGPSTKAFYGHLVEFGTAHSAAKPFLRPAWDAHKRSALDSITKDLADEIEKARARLARKAEREAAKMR